MQFVRPGSCREHHLRSWQPSDVTCEEPLLVHKAGTRVPRLKYAYGPRVSGGNPAWDYLGRR